MKKYGFPPQRLISPYALSAFACVTLALSFTAGCGASADDPGTYSTEELEAVAYSIDRSLICPVCPAETIDQAQVQLAKQMRALVREKLAEGWTREQILDLFVESYGEHVLASPPKSGFNLLVWVVPPVGAAGALVLLASVVVAMRRTGGGGPTTAVRASEGELEPYLSIVDQELGLSTANPSDANQDSDETDGGASRG